MVKRITEIIKHGESETVEFKTSFGKDVIETAVAFANTRGGTILIGVSDDGGVIGAKFGKEALRDYVNRIAVATEPSLIRTRNYSRSNSLVWEESAIAVDSGGGSCRSLA